MIGVAAEDWLAVVTTIDDAANRAGIFDAQRADGSSLPPRRICVKSKERPLYAKKCVTWGDPLNQMIIKKIFRKR